MLAGEKPGHNILSEETANKDRIGHRFVPGSLPSESGSGRKTFPIHRPGPGCQSGKSRRLSSPEGGRPGFSWKRRHWSALRCPGDQQRHRILKGIQNQTLGLILTYLKKPPGVWHTEEVIAEKAALTAVTVCRYLTYLTEAGVVTTDIYYNTGGRPCMMYRIRCLSSKQKIRTPSRLGSSSDFLCM